jgi:hypothetical protein
MSHRDIFVPVTLNLAPSSRDRIDLRSNWFSLSRSSTYIDNGRLVALDMADAPPGDYQLHAICRTDMPPGPAASWLIERMRTEV